MTELLFGLTIVFAAYVIYEVYKTVSQPDDGSGHYTKASSPAPTPVAPTPEAPKESKPDVKPVAAAAATSAVEEKNITLRNPETGETSPVPSNYRFAKKWVKEALVAEGLLSKVYKNSELTGAVNDNVKAALTKLKDLEKYHA